MSSPTPFADWDAVQFDPARHDPRTGMYLKRYTARDGSTQEYSVYIPAGYAPDRPWPLLLAMHGLGQNHLDIINNPQIQFAAERRGFLVASAQGRGRRNFYRGLGEEDALQVVEEMRRAFNVDPDRVYMSGVSMGGSSSMHLGLHFPDLWAASHPVCGLYAFGSMGLPAEVDYDPYELVNQGDVSYIAENGFGLPLRFVHGDADATVPVEHGRRMRDRFAEIGVPAVYQEVPDFPHGDSDTLGRLDWLMAFRRNRHPLRVTYKTYSLSYDRAAWVRVEDFVRWNQAGFIRAEAAFGNQIKVETDNLAQFSLFCDGALLDLTQPVKVTVDGQEVHHGPAPADRVLTLHRLPGFAADPWRHGPLPQHEGALRKNRDICGPMNDVFRDPFIAVYGASGSADAMAVNRREAEKLLAWLKERYNADNLLKSDAEVSEDDIARYHLVLFGTPEANTLLAMMLPGLPLTVDANGLTLDGRRFDGSDVGIQFVYPNPLNPARYVEIGTGVADSVIANIDQIPGRGTNDYVVFNAASKAGGGGFVQIGNPLAKGFFDGSWRVESEEEQRDRWAAEARLVERTKARLPLRPEAAVGRPCPSFVFTSLQGQEVRSSDILGRKALAVLFTGAPLAPAMTACLRDLARRYPDDLALILVAAVPNNWEKGAIRRYLEVRGLSFPVTNDENMALARAFGKQSAPEGYFVRRDGLVTRAARDGNPLLSDPEAFARQVRALIG